MTKGFLVEQTEVGALCDGQLGTEGLTAKFGLWIF